MARSLSGERIEFVEALDKSSFKNPQVEAALFNTSVLGHGGLHMDSRSFIGPNLIPPVD